MPSTSTSKRSAQRAFTVGLLLQKLNQGQHSQSIAKQLNKSKQLLNYYIRRLETEGYIQRKVRSNIVIYDLLPKGKEFLERHDSYFQRGVLPRFHRYAHKHVVLGGFEGLERFLPLVSGRQMNNGVVQVHGSFEFDNEKFSVRRWHSPSREDLAIYIPATYSSSIGDALVKAGIKLDRVARAIQERWGIQLGEYEKMQGAEWAYEKDPFARYWYDLSAGGVVKTADGTIDASEGAPEAEFFTTESAAAYLRMPQAVQKQGNEIQAIKETLSQTAEAFKQATQAYVETTDRFGKNMDAHLKLIEKIGESAEATRETAESLRQSVNKTTDALRETIQTIQKDQQRSWMSRLFK